MKHSHLCLCGRNPVFPVTLRKGSISRFLLRVSSRETSGRDPAVRGGLRVCVCVRVFLRRGHSPPVGEEAGGPAARKHPAQTPSQSQRQADSILGAQGAPYRRRGHGGERAPEERGCGHTRRAPSPPRGATAFPGSKATPHPRRPRISLSQAGSPKMRAAERDPTEHNLLQ